MRLPGKTALAKGSASKFAAEIVRVLADESAKVVPFELNHDRAQAIGERIGAGAAAITPDVAKRSDVDRALDKAGELGRGGFDIILNKVRWTHGNKPILEVAEEVCAPPLASCAIRAWHGAPCP